MKKSEAYRLLELSESASKDDAKKAFRKLASKYHPDVCKDADAETKFKEVNSAYQAIENNKFDDVGQTPFHGSHYPSGFDNIMQDLFRQGGFGGNQGGFSNKTYNIRHEDDIKLSVDISFKDSVLGCKAPLSYLRKSKCSDCSGVGKQGNCPICGGTGFRTVQQGNAIFSQRCGECHKHRKTSCAPCKETGYIETNINVEVNIPPGVQSSNTLRLNGVGHFCGASPLGEQYSDVHLKVNVGESNGMRIVDHNVESDIAISLLEALQGTTKEIITIDGSKTITISPKTRNDDVCNLKNLGLVRKGNHIVNIKVYYPDDVSDLINFLTPKEVSNGT